METKCWPPTAYFCLVLLNLSTLPLSWAAPADPDLLEEYPENDENLFVAVGPEALGEIECCLCSGYPSCVIHYNSDNLTVVRVEEVGSQQDATLTCQLYRCHHDYDSGQVICNREQRILNSQEISDEIQFLNPQESRCHEQCCLALMWADPSESFYQDVVPERGLASCNSSCLMQTSIKPVSTSVDSNTTTDVNVTWLETSHVTRASTVGEGNSSGFETTAVLDESTSNSAESGSVSLATKESSSVQESGNRTSGAIHGENLETNTKGTDWTIVIVCSVLGVLVLVIILATVLYCRKKEKLCFHNSNSSPLEQEPMNSRKNSSTNEVIEGASAALLQNETNC